METNIALGLFVNSTQLLFRVTGAPPCHNNSLKEEQFNVNSIFSICLLMKTSQSTGKMFLLFQKEKHNRERWTAHITWRHSQRRSISPSLTRAFPGTHPFVFAFFFFKDFFFLEESMQFSHRTPRNDVPADWCAWPCLHQNKMVFHPPASSFFFRGLIAHR